MKKNPEKEVNSTKLIKMFQDYEKTEEKLQNDLSKYDRKVSSFFKQELPKRTSKSIKTP